MYLAGGGLVVSYDFAVRGAAIARNYSIGGFSSAKFRQRLDNDGSRFSPYQLRFDHNLFH
jgi:hypothetical protein